MALDITAVNELNCEKFVEVFGGLFEKTPLIAASVWSNRPFSDAKALHESLCEFVRRLPALARAGLLRCYPDLAGKLAQQRQLTPESYNEHKSAGLLELNTEELQEISELNRKYRDKFGWPFIICARENKKAAILDGLKKRLLKSSDAELQTGINEVCNIAWHRLVDIVGRCTQNRL